MRLIIITISLLFTAQITAQNTFYLTPSINTKLSIGSTNWTHYSNKFPQNEYFEIYNVPLNFSRFIGLGFSLDWKNENNDFMLGLSWNQDVAGVGARELYLSTNEGDPAQYFNQELLNKSSFFINRFSLNFTKPLIQDHLFLKLGAGFIFSQSGHKNDGDIYTTTIGFDPFLHDTNIIIGRTYTRTANYRFSLNLSVGLTADINWNEKYLFTLDIIYTQGFKNITAASYIYDVTNLNTGKTEVFSYGIFSRGSGITFQISRRLQIHPWIPLSKKKRQLN